MKVVKTHSHAVVLDSTIYLNIMNIFVIRDKLMWKIHYIQVGSIPHRYSTCRYNITTMNSMIVVKTGSHEAVLDSSKKYR